MGKIVFMFPGQGAQYVGMGKDFYDSFACSKEIFDKANEVLDIDVKKLCFEENEDINITEYTQAAMVTASVAILKKIEEMGLKPDLTAGLSLGEYCALVASDVMSFESRKAERNSYAGYCSSRRGCDVSGSWNEERSDRSSFTRR